MADINIICSQNCKNAGEEYANHKGYHKCNKEGITLNSLEKRSGCKYCPYIERLSGGRKKKT